MVDEIRPIADALDDDDVWIEELGRRAGRAARQPAPEAGLDALRLRRRRRTTRLAGAAVAASVALAAGVLLVTRKGSDDDVSTAVTTPPTVPASTTASAPVPGPVTPEVRWAADYLGVEPGPAAAEPYKIGWLGTEGSQPGDREMLDRMVAYLNANVGGAGGRPIELVACEYRSLADQAQCASQFAANSDIDLVLTDLVEFTELAEPDASTYLTMSTTKAVGVVWHNEPSYMGSGAGAVLSMDGVSGYRAMVSLATEVISTPARNLVVVNDVDLSRQAGPWQDLLADHPGTRVTHVDVLTGATADDIAQAIRDTPGALEGDAYITYGRTGAWCSNVPAARAQLGLTAPLALMDVCISTETEANPRLSADQARLLEGVYVWAGGIDLLDPRETGLHVYAAATGNSGTSWAIFGALMLAARIVNEHGDVETITADDFRTAFTTYHGPVPLSFGPFNCGRTGEGMAFDAGEATCIEYSGVYRYVDGELTTVANGRNGKLLGFNGLVEADPNLFPSVD